MSQESQRLIKKIKTEDLEQVDEELAKEIKDEKRYHDSRKRKRQDDDSKITTRVIRV